MANMQNMSPQAMAAWDALMQSWGQPLTPTSAYRDPAYNESVGGARGSQHIHGNAFDVSTAGMTPEQRTALIQQARAAGFTGFGGYDNSLHFDVGPSRTWGSDYTGATTPDWLREALGSAPVQISTSGVNAMPMTPQQPMGLLGQLGIQKQDPTATDQTALPFYQRDQFKDTMGSLAMAFNELRQRPSAAIPQAVMAGRERRIETTQRNATADWLQSQPNGSQFAQMLQAGADPAQVLQAYQQYQTQQAALARGQIMEVDGRLVHVGADQSVTELMPKAVDQSKVGEMRREFNALPAVKDFDTFSRSYGSMVVAASDHTGPADMALIFNYMKMLDPNSTVREGEYATAQNSGGASDRFRSLYNSIVDGQTLTNNQRDQFMNVASNIYADAQRRYQGVVDQYTANAEAAGFDPERVITQYGYTGPEYQAQIPLPKMPAGITVDGRPATQEEWDYYWGALSVEEQKRFMETGELPND